MKIKKDDTIYLIDKFYHELYVLNLDTKIMNNIKLNIEDGYLINDCIIDYLGRMIVKYSKNDTEHKYYLLEIK